MVMQQPCVLIVTMCLGISKFEPAVFCATSWKGVYRQSWANVIPVFTPNTKALVLSSVSFYGLVLDKNFVQKTWSWQVLILSQAAVLAVNE